MDHTPLPPFGAEKSRRALLVFHSRRDAREQAALWERLVLIASTKSSAVLTMSFFVLWEFRR